MSLSGCVRFLSKSGFWPSEQSKSTSLFSAGSCFFWRTTAARKNNNYNKSLITPSPVLALIPRWPQNTLMSFPPKYRQTESSLSIANSAYNRQLKSGAHYPQQNGPLRCSPRAENNQDGSYCPNWLPAVYPTLINEPHSIKSNRKWPKSDMRHTLINSSYKFDRNVMKTGVETLQTCDMKSS